MESSSLHDGDRVRLQAPGTSRDNQSVTNCSSWREGRRCSTSLKAASMSEVAQVKSLSNWLVICMRETKQVKLLF